MTTTFLVAKNNANSKLASAISAIATTLTVVAGEGARFPSTFPYHISIDNEIVKVTNRVTDTLTIERHQEGTSAVAHGAGAGVFMNITAQAITELQAAINALEVRVTALEA